MGRLFCLDLAVDKNGHSYIFNQKHTMIHLAKQATAQTIKMPMRYSTAPSSGDWKLSLTSAMGKQVSLLDAIVSIPSPSYCVVTITIDGGCKSGEYEYSLTRGDVVASSGMAVIGNYERATSQYVKNEEYIQYEHE